MSLVAELRARGLVHQIAEHEERPLEKLLETPQTAYAGFDPTAPSLHVGNLIPLLGLARFQRAGHRAIAIAGGSTGMVGDPSGRSSERNLLDEDTLRANMEVISRQLEAFLDMSPGRGLLLDNLSFIRDVTFLEFLRDIGKHFPINSMLRKDSVKNRLGREGEGISFTEFSYMLLQAFDFLALFREHDCRVQIGGSDQWGNITAGTELIRRKLGGQAYGLTCPLLLNSDGSKFGKSAGGAVWLDPQMTSPFAFRQFWFKSADADVFTRMRYFTFIPVEEIDALEAEVAAGAPPNTAQKRLAETMTELVHGPSEAARVEKAVGVLFDPKADLRELPVEYLADAFEGAPVVTLPRARFAGEGIGWHELVTEVVHAGKSRSAARRDIQQNAIALNGRKLKDLEARVNADRLLHERFLVLKKGKKNVFLVEAVADS